MKLFAIRDAKTEQYGNPFSALTPADALRSFTAGANNPQSMVCQFPEDYALFQLGEYNQKTGTLTSLAQPFRLALAQEVIKRPETTASQNTAH